MFSLPIRKSRKKREEFFEFLFSFEVEMDKTYSQNFVTLGLLHEKMGQFNLAHNLFEKALRLSTRNGDAYFHLGTMYIRWKQYTTAGKYLEKALQYSIQYGNVFWTRKIKIFSLVRNVCFCLTFKGVFEFF